MEINTADPSAAGLLKITDAVTAILKQAQQMANLQQAVVNVQQLARLLLEDLHHCCSRLLEGCL